MQTLAVLEATNSHYALLESDMIATCYQTSRQLPP